MSSVRVPAPAGPSLLSASAKSKGDRHQRLAAWGHAAIKRLRHLGLAIDGCEIDGGGLLFVPDGRLTLTLDARLDGVTHARAVEVALVLPAPDLAGLRSLLADSGRTLALLMALQSLPEQFAIGASSDARRFPAPKVSSDDLRALLDRAEQEGCAVWLGWSVPRDIAAAHAATLDGQLQDALVALGHILKHLAPSSAAESIGPRRGRRRAGSHGEEEPARKKPRGRAERASDRRDAEPEGEREVESESVRETETPAPRIIRPLEAKPRLRASLKRRSPFPASAGALIEKGTRVRVLEGPFAGKEGLVQELDGNGGARVMLGLLAVRIDVKDLVSAAVARARPRLSSSHRRPLPVRS
jgi:hypothetical protein